MAPKNRKHLTSDHKCWYAHCTSDECKGVEREIVSGKVLTKGLSSQLMCKSCRAFIPSAASIWKK